MDIAATLRFSKIAVHNAIVKFNGDGMLQDKVWSSTEDHAHGRPLYNSDRNALVKELLQGNPSYFSLIGYSIKFQHRDVSAKNLD